MQEAMEQEARSILTKLQEQGHEAYFVGGCVRDAVLGRKVKDIDIATSALPEQVMACFPRTAPTGLQHGTVMVLLEQGTYEVTTFRTESQYESYRRPKEVAFITSLTEDLRRRDFTMNAMAMDHDLQIIDPFGGQKDLKAGILRCVGKAEERFGEDALRMLRCVRFASTYGLEVEAKTWQALLRQAPLLRHIAMERVRSELQRMIEGPAPARAVRLLLASRLWRHFKKQLKLPFEMWLTQPLALEAVSALPEQHTRWAMLLLLLQAPTDEVRTALQELTFSRADTDAVVGVLALHERLAGQLLSPAAAEAGRLLDLAQLERVWKLAALKHGREPAKAALRVWQALLLAQARAEAGGEDLARSAGWSLPTPSSASSAPQPLVEFLQTLAPLLVQYGNGWLEEIPCMQLKELAITGSQLVERANKPAGPWIGEKLTKLLEEVALGQLPNEREALLKASMTTNFTNDESGF
jgi:tRNA nucleotidyltransferase (CCA-adding enzyme)